MAAYWVDRGHDVMVVTLLVYCVRNRWHVRAAEIMLEGRASWKQAHDYAVPVHIG